MRTRNQIATDIAMACRCGTLTEEVAIHDRVLDGLAEFEAGLRTLASETEARAAWRAYAAAALDGILARGEFFAERDPDPTVRVVERFADALLAAERARFDAPAGGKP